MEEVLSIFNTWMEYVTFYSRGLQFGTLKFHFKNEEMTYIMAMSPLRTEKSVFYPMYMGRRLVELRIGGIPPEFRPEWLVTAILANTEDPL